MTRAGEQFLSNARHALESAARAVATARQTDSATGLKFAHSDLYVYTPALLKLLAAFRAACPQTPLRIVRLDEVDQHAALREQRIDVAATFVGTWPSRPPPAAVGVRAGARPPPPLALGGGRGGSRGPRGAAGPPPNSPPPLARDPILGEHYARHAQRRPRRLRLRRPDLSRTRHSGGSRSPPHGHRAARRPAGPALSGCGIRPQRRRAAHPGDRPGRDRDTQPVASSDRQAMPAGRTPCRHR